MKFRDPETGLRFKSIRGALAKYCHAQECNDCPFGWRRGRNTCVDWARANTAEAAQLMGYEIIEEDEPMDNKKPLSEWTLGEAKSFCNKNAGGDLCGSGCPLGVICDQIEDSGKFAPGDWDLTDKPRWTEADIEDAKAIMRVSGATWAARDESGSYGLWFYDCEPDYKDGMYYKVEGHMYVPARSSLIPSLKLGQKVRLEDIIRG